MDTLDISSPDFVNEGWISDRNSGYGEDLSPKIHIANIEERTVSMVITLDDLDHPLQPGYNHWVAWNIPPVGILPEGLPKGAKITEPVAMEQGIAYGKHCYRGPKPPFHWKHRYCFTVYTLDTTLNISTDANKRMVMEVIKEHILQTASCMDFIREGINETEHRLCDDAFFWECNRFIGVTGDN